MVCMDPREYNYEQEFVGNSIGLKGLCQNKETKNECQIEDDFNC